MDQTPINTDNSAPIVSQNPIRQPRGPIRRALWPQGLSGKLLVITTVFIMLIEILVFVPSVANFRLTWLDRHFTTGETASLALLRLVPEEISERVKEQFLDISGTDMINVRHDGVSQVLAARNMPSSVDQHVEMLPRGQIPKLSAIIDAFDTLIFGGDRKMRVFGPMEYRPGRLELVMNDTQLRDAMLNYARNVMLISLLISFTTAILIFLVLRWFMIRPLQNMTQNLLQFAEDPEDSQQIITPTGRDDEIGIAEEQLSAMQLQMRSTMNQQRHLANLGMAVSKINHDLRNLLASASLFVERLNTLEDPTVKRLAPRLVRAIDRAVDYTRSVLAYGRAGEDVPKRSLLKLHQLVEDVGQVLGLDLDQEVTWENKVPKSLEIEADGDQIYCVTQSLPQRHPGHGGPCS